MEPKPSVSLAAIHVKPGCEAEYLSLVGPGTTRCGTGQRAGPANARAKGKRLGRPVRGPGAMLPKRGAGTREAAARNGPVGAVAQVHARQVAGVKRHALCNRSNLPHCQGAARRLRPLAAGGRKLGKSSALPCAGQ